MRKQEMTFRLVEWYVAQAFSAAKVALGPGVDPELLERAVRSAVLELADGGVAVTEYVAELAFHRVVADARSEAGLAADGGEAASVAA
jgi:hypothetical protein